MAAWIWDFGMRTRNGHHCKTYLKITQAVQTMSCFGVQLAQDESLCKRRQVSNENG